MKKFFVIMAVFLTICVIATGCGAPDYEDYFSRYDDDEFITAEAESEPNFDTTKNTAIVTNEITGDYYLTSADITKAVTTVFPENTVSPNIITTSAKAVVTTSDTVTVTTTTTTTTTAVVTAAPAPIPDNSYSNIVYVAASGKGKKYHNNPDCSNMKGNVVSISIDNAVARGYTPCKKCYG